jgi:hypothetical protein
MNPGCLTMCIVTNVAMLELGSGIAFLCPRPRWRSAPSGKPTGTDHEARVSRYFEDYAGQGKPWYIYVARHPIKSLRALFSLYRLPSLDVAAPAATVEGAPIRAQLSERPMVMHTVGLVRSVLSLPQEAGQYSLGASKQTLRRKVRQARRLGVRWAEVNDPQERQRLVKLAEEYVRTHPDVTYRNANPDTSDLFGYGLWLAAYSAEGHPLLLSVTPIDGEIGLLRYFRTLGGGEEQSKARYLMTEVLVEHLVNRGVRYLVDGLFPAWLPNGLRHYQRMVGFRIVRLRLVPDAGRAKERSQ